MKVLALLGLIFAVASAAAERPDQLPDAERLARRFDPEAAARRNAAAIAAGRVQEITGSDVVVGQDTPELLMPWELMDHVSAIILDEALLAKHREKWRARGAARLLGSEDFVARLRNVAGPLVGAEAELRRLGEELRAANGAERDVRQARASEVMQSLCRLRAEALAASRTTFGHENFQRFLYEVVAPDAVIRTSRSASPRGMMDMWQWMEDGCP